MADAIFKVHALGFAHRNIVPRSVIVNDNFDAIQLIGFKSVVSKDKKNDRPNGVDSLLKTEQSEYWAEGSLRHDLFGFAMLAFRMQCSQNQFDVLKKLEDLNTAYANARHYHHFTRFADLIYGYLAFGENPDKRNQKEYLMNILDDTQFKLEEGALVAYNIAEIYDIQTSNLALLMSG